MLQLKFIVTTWLRKYKPGKKFFDKPCYSITYDLKVKTNLIKINIILHSKIQVLDPEATINNSTKQ